MSTENGNVAYRRAHCPHCDEERMIRVTVPWQDDLCSTCMNPVPADETEPLPGRPPVE